MKKRKSRAPWVLVAVALLAGGAWGVWSTDWIGGNEEQATPGAPVRRGPLRVSVLQRGNLESKNSIKIKSEIEGQTTILSLVPEGTFVREGDLLVVLDDSDQRDRRDAQQIAVHNAEADLTKAKQQYKIQQSQNQSDIAAGKQRVDFARTDLKKYLEGDWPQTLQQAEEEIVLAREEEASARNRLEWSRNLSERGFLTRTELERDELAFQRAGILLEQAKREKDLLIRFEYPREKTRLEADLTEAEAELERIELQAAARLVDFEAAMRTSEARFQLESEKLAKLDRQIANSRIHAPAEGFVVYARENSGRWGGGEPVQEGKNVREREEILSLPREGGMIAEASVHETVLEQVEVGQPCIVEVDALPGRQFAGRVEFVALLPDKSSWWANPNQRLYKTEISITDATEEIRPGMSCSIEILIDELEDVLYVPVQAIFVDGGETIAFVAGDEAELRPVEVGQSNEQWVEIRSGLSEGEYVLLSPPAGFAPKAAPAAEDEGGEAGPDRGPAAARGLAGGAERPGSNGREGREGREGRSAWSGQADAARGQWEGRRPEGDGAERSGPPVGDGSEREGSGRGGPRGDAPPPAAAPAAPAAPAEGAEGEDPRSETSGP